MNITVIALGKLKEDYLKNAVSEYSKRISAYGKLNIIELLPARLSQAPSKAETENALALEQNSSYSFYLINGKLRRIK